jgi:hypothetical protein
MVSCTVGDQYRWAENCRVAVFPETYEIENSSTNSLLFPSHSLKAKGEES